MISRIAPSEETSEEETPPKIRTRRGSPTSFETPTEETREEGFVSRRLPRPPPRRRARRRFENASRRAPAAVYGATADDLCEAEDDGAAALNQVVDDLRARALQAEAEASQAETLVAEALRARRRARAGADAADATRLTRRPREAKGDEEGPNGLEEEEGGTGEVGTTRRRRRERDANRSQTRRVAAAENADAARARAKAASDASWTAEVREAPRSSPP